MIHTRKTSALLVKLLACEVMKRGKKITLLFPQVGQPLLQFLEVLLLPANTQMKNIKSEVKGIIEKDTSIHARLHHKPVDLSLIYWVKLPYLKHPETNKRVLVDCVWNHMYSVW